MIERDEQELRERFLALRREDGVSTPAFAATIGAARDRRKTHAGVGLLAFAVTVMAVVGLILVFRIRERQSAVIDLRAVGWHAPTDFLLEVPGDDVLRSVPTFTIDWRLLK
jgi:hypothetical protein